MSAASAVCLSLRLPKAEMTIAVCTVTITDAAARLGPPKADLGVIARNNQQAAGCKLGSSAGLLTCWPLSASIGCQVTPDTVQAESVGLGGSPKGAYTGLTMCPCCWRGGAAHTWMGLAKQCAANI
jgi:hypothetical protein